MSTYRVPGHVFQHFLRAVRSLTDSTEVELHHSGIVARVDGRCSTLVSHRGVEYDTVSTQATMVRNRKYAVAFTMEEDLPAPDLRARELQALRHEWHYAVVPAALLRPLADTFSYYFGHSPIPQTGLVELWVAMPILSHYREDGRPVYIPVTPAED